MLKRVWVLAGTAFFSLAALLSLIWLMSSSPPVVHADLAETTISTPLQRLTRQAAAQSCVTVDADVAISDTWTGACYRIMTNTVTIYPGVVLTISPPVTGTRIEFQVGAQLQVLGDLKALGTASRPITFTSANTTSPACSDWLGIILEDDSGGDVIQHAVVEYARTGVKINDEDDVYILSNTFRYNGGSGSTNGAIGGDTDHSRITNNRIYSCTNGIALTEAGYNTIVSNTISDVDHYGLILVASGVGGGSSNYIADNVIAACADGGLRLEDGDSNRVFSNTVYLNPGGGIYLDDQSVTSVRHNHVYSNGGGSGYRAAVVITNTSFLSDVIHNVVYDENAEAIAYDASNGGGGPLIASNALCSIPSFELQNDDSVTIDAPANWWSTNTPTDSVSGPVDFTPWISLSLAGTADGVVTVTLQDRDGHTVPPPPDRQTAPPAPNARRIELSTNWGTLSPAVVFVDGQGIATAILVPEPTLGPDTIVFTATDFCGYAVTGTIELPNLVITKTAAATQVVAGDVLTYLVSFANTGRAAATGVRITDTLPAGTVWAGDTAVSNGWTRLTTAPPTWFTPTLSPGAHGSFCLSVTVSPATCGLSLTNRATIGTPILETSLDDNVSYSPPVTVVCADLAIAKFARPPEGPPDAPIHFTIVYTNDSTTAADATITDWLPQNTTYLTDTSGLVLTRSPGRLTWTVPSLAPNESDSFTVTLSYTSTVCPATLTNTVAISSTIPDLTPEDNVYTATYRVVCNVDLVVVKDDDVGPASPLNAFLTVGKQSAVGRLLRTASEQAPLTETSFGLVLAQHREFVHEGDLVTYTVAVVNTGSFTATDVVLVETIPEHTDYVGIGWTHVTTRTYTQTVGTLAPGAGRVYYLVVRVRDVVPAGVDNLVNRVCGWSDETDVYPDDNCNYEDTPFRSQPLRVEKSAEDCISPGDAFNYRVTYQNTTADTTFYSVELTDTLPAYVSYTGGPEWSCIGQICSRVVISIPPGTTGTLLLPVQLSAAFPYTVQTSITNVVEIQGGDQFVLVTPIDTGPDLSVIKNDNVGPLPTSLQARWEALGRRLHPLRLLSSFQATQQREFVRPGERITYTILYLNDGFGPATGVVLTETLPLYTSYVGGGWTHAGDRQYVLNIGDLAPGEGGGARFIVQVDDPFPPGTDRVINRVDIGGGIPECNQSDNWSADDTPVQTDLQLYVANRHSGTVDVFNTTDFDHVKTIALGANPYGMAVSGDHLFVADFAEDGAHGSVQVIDLLSDTVIASTVVGAHPVHVAAYDGHVYVAGHSGPPPITVIRADAPWDIVAEMYLDRHLTYEFGFFGATADESRGCVYLTKPDFGSVGVWRLTPVSTTWMLDYVYPTDATQSQNLRSILYHPTTDRVYSAIGLIDELWVFDPDDWELVERIPTGHQDPTNPGYGAHGLAALGQCVFVSNYLDESVTAVVDGSCVESLGPGSAAPPAGSYRVYLPAVGKRASPGRRIVTIPVSGRPEGMVGVSNLLFVTLPHEDRVAIINTETLTVIDEIHTQGDYPHTAILAGGNYLNRGP
jgi:uncharacterized repeat protein (TIGR01451 family)